MENVAGAGIQVLDCALSVNVLQNDNLDWGLYAKGFNVWQPSWTRQEAYGTAKQYWERVMRKGKS